MSGGRKNPLFVTGFSDATRNGSFHPIAILRGPRRVFGHVRGAIATSGALYGQVGPEKDRIAQKALIRELPSDLWSPMRRCEV